MVVVHAFNPSTWETEAGDSEFEASLVYRAGFRTAKDTQRDPVSKKPNQQTNLSGNILIMQPDMGFHYDSRSSEAANEDQPSKIYSLSSMSL